MAPVRVEAVASSGLQVGFEVVSGAAELNGDILSPLHAGSVTLRASQMGDATWLPAPDIETILTFARSVQTITFAIPKEKLVYNLRLRLTASASSGLPIDFIVVSGPGELSDGNLLYANGLGEIIVEALQAGDENYEPASTQQSITVWDSPALSVDGLNGKLVLTWPDDYAGFVLESAITVDGPWAPVMASGPDQNRSNIAAEGELRFFRLKAN
jgi:hypothetical protein